MKLKKSHEARPPEAKRAKPSTAGMVAGLALAGLGLMVSPLIERNAHAQPREAAAAVSLPQVEGAEPAVVMDGTTKIDTHLVSRQRKSNPTIPVKGPGTLKVRFYPAVMQDWFQNGTESVPRPVRYTLGKNGDDTVEQVFPGATKLSPCTSADIQSPLAIGTPIDMLISIPEGEHRFRIVSPNGFLKVNGMERPAPRPEPAPVKAPAKRPEPAPVKVVAPVEPPRHEPHQLFRMQGMRTGLHGLGPMENSGDVNDIMAVGSIPLPHHLSVLVGAGYGSWGLGVETQETSTDMRSHTGTLAAGIALSRGRHHAYALLRGGYTNIFTEASDGPNSADQSYHRFEYGGELGYSFDSFVHISLLGSNSPFNPITARIHGELPFGWAERAHPWAELSMMWIHALAPAEAAGAVTASESVLYGHLVAGIPIWRIGPVVPSAILAGELNASGEGLHHANFMLGGALRLDIRGIDIEFAGAASPLDATPLFMLRASYSR